MQTNITTVMPGYKLNEYLLVLRPHEELWKKITKVKEQFAEKYKSEYGRWGGPQITLVKFVQHEMMEERLVNRLAIAAMSFPPFKVELRDFGSLPSHTIYINLVSKLPVQSLVKEVRSQTQRLMKLNEENKPLFILEPYITVAGKLKPWQYEKGWLEYSQKNFTGRFIADEMLLLKRPVGELKYKTLRKFAFQNLPVSTKQGELFS